MHPNHPSPLLNTIKTTVIALFITVAMLVLAWLTWHKYQSRQHYLQLITVTTPYQKAINRCYTATRALFMCQPGQYGIPNNINASQHHKHIAQLNVTSGKIVLVPKNYQGIKSRDTYVLTPYLSHQHIAWHVTGGAVESGYVSQP